MTQIDRPEPRWQVILALLAVAGIYMALPKELIMGPAWLLPALVVVLLVPTVFAHRTGRHSLNHILGIAIGAIITFGLIVSVVLLVTTIPGGKDSGLALLRSGGALWLTNVLVFALWYWRLDGGGPRKRETEHEFGSRSFVFPQMQIEKMERKTFGIDGWRPGLSLHRLYHQFNIWPDGCAGPDSLGKTPRHDADIDLAHDHGPSDLAGGRRAMSEGRSRVEAA
jgi:hypothetical protein